MMPEAELARVITPEIWDLANYFGVPEELVYQRISEFATDEEKEHWNKAFSDYIPA